MASFDVSSLYTNIPLDESNDLCTDLLFGNQETIEYNNCRFDRINFRMLLSFAVKDNHFMFDRRLYDQIDGMAMGSPLGPSLVNVFMCVLENRYLNNCTSQFKPFLYRCYADDTFCLFKDENHVNLFFNHINKHYPNLKFTSK